MSSRLVYCYAKAFEKPVRVLVRNWHKEPIHVTWKKPQEGWTKLNYDGSYKWKTGNASIGGLFRDHNADFLLGYAESIGRKSNNTVAESAALMRGLEIALENGWSDILVEGDSKGLIDIISNRKKSKCEKVQNHVERIHFLIREVENCILTHVFREGNRAADKFAEIGYLSNKPQMWRDIPPSEVQHIVDEDAQGRTFIRKRQFPKYTTFAENRSIAKRDENIMWFYSNENNEHWYLTSNVIRRGKLYTPVGLCVPKKL